MSIKRLARYLCILCVSIYSITTTAQNGREPYYAKQQLELKHDNDFLHFTDRYYTTGSFIGYRRLLNEASESEDKRQFSLYVEQSFYTPTNILSSKIEDFDRPYAGFLGFEGTLSIVNFKRILDFTFAIGVTGEISGSEGLQRWFHSTNDSQTAQWTSQIENSTHANLYGSYVREWKLYEGSLNIIAATRPALALGTKDYYIENQAKIYIGKRNDLQNTVAYRQLGSIKSEVFIALQGSYRFVIHDAMLEGSIITDNSEFTLEPKQDLFFYGAEGYWRTRRMDFKIAYTFVTRRAISTRTHGYTTFSISRNF